LQGDRLRIDYRRGEETSTTIIDVEKQRVILLDTLNRAARITPLERLRGKASDVGIGEPRATLTPTAKKRTIAGQQCKIHELDASVPFRAGGDAGIEMTVVLRGPACLSKDAPGYREYATFLRKAAEKGFAIGDTGRSRKNSAIWLYKTMAEGGLLLDQQLAIRFRGPEPMASMLNDMGPARFANVVTKIDTKPIAPALFEIPDGFAVEE
jgi:hypothetical protein